MKFFTRMRVVRMVVMLVVVVVVVAVGYFIGHKLCYQFLIFCCVGGNVLFQEWIRWKTVDQKPESDRQKQKLAMWGGIATIISIMVTIHASFAGIN